MPTSKITWAEIKNHLHYGKWAYLLIALVAWFGFDLIYTMTEYRASAEHKVDFQLVQGGYMESEALSEVAARALKVGQAYDGTLEEVQFLTVQYSGDAQTDIYGAQVYTVRMQAREGDIWVVPRRLFDQLYEMDAFMRLDDYIARGLLDVAGADLSAVTLPAPSKETAEDGSPLAPDGEMGVYGLPVSMMPGIRQAGYVAEDAVIAIMAFSTNPDTAAVVLQAAIDEMKGGALPVSAEET